MDAVAGSAVALALLLKVAGAAAVERDVVLKETEP